MFLFSLIIPIKAFLFPLSPQRGDWSRGVVEYLIKDTVMFSEISIFEFNKDLNMHKKINNGYKIIMRTFEAKSETIDSLIYESTLINTAIGPEGTGNFFFTAPSSTYFTIKYFIEPLYDDIVLNNNLSLEIKHFIGTAGDDKIVSYPETLINFLEKEISAAISKCEDLLTLFKSNGLKDLELDSLIDKLKFIIYATIIIKIVVIVISFYLSNKSTNSFFSKILRKK